MNFQHPPEFLLTFLGVLLLGGAFYSLVRLGSGDSPPEKQPRMSLESFRSPNYCTVGLQKKETAGNARLKILEWESIGARSHKGPSYTRKIYGMATTLISKQGTREG